MNIHTLQRRKNKTLSFRLELTEAEQRAKDWCADMENMGGKIQSTAFMALQTIHAPDPMFVFWLSEGHLGLVGGQIIPITSDAVAQLKEDGLYFPEKSYS
jgi:hypothetical protein